jgi:hypothetical protein
MFDIQTSSHEEAEEVASEPDRDVDTGANSAESYLNAGADRDEDMGEAELAVRHSASACGRSLCDLRPRC